MHSHTVDTPDHSPTPTTPGRRRLLVKILVLTPVLQYLFLLGMSLFYDPAHITCTNWHGEALPCSLITALAANLLNVLLLNLFSLGIATVITVAVAAFVVVAFEACVPPRIARSRLLWGAVLGCVVAVVALRGVQTGELRGPAPHGAGVDREPPEIRVITGGRGGAQIFDPAVYPEPAGPPVEDPGGAESPPGEAPDRPAPQAAQ